MKNPFRSLYFLIIFTLLIFSTYNSSSIPSTGETPTIMKDENGVYQIVILLSQWDIRAFDEVYVVSTTGVNISNFGSNLEKIWLPYAYMKQIGPFERGSLINFHVYSKDIQHGFAISQLNFSVAPIRPTGQETVGPATNSGNLALPSVNTKLTAYCDILCGLGHEQMRIDFFIGFWENTTEVKIPLNFFKPFLAIILVRYLSRKLGRIE